MTDSSNEPRKSKRTTSAVVGALAVLVLGGATTAFAIQACAESTPSPSVPGDPTTPSASTSSTAKPVVPPSPNMPPPPT